MNIAEEIQKLEALHREGTLSDEEFSKAKAAVIAGAADGKDEPSPKEEPPPGPSQRAPWGCLFVLIVVAVVAGATNPDKTSLEKAWKAHRDHAIGAAGLQEHQRMAADLLTRTTVARRSYFFFSIAKIQTGLRFQEARSECYAIGLFGFWWFLDE